MTRTVRVCRQPYHRQGDGGQVGAVAAAVDPHGHGRPGGGGQLGGGAQPSALEAGPAPLARQRRRGEGVQDGVGGRPGDRGT